MTDTLDPLHGLSPEFRNVRMLELVPAITEAAVRLSCLAVSGNNAGVVEFQPGDATRYVVSMGRIPRARSYYFGSTMGPMYPMGSGLFSQDYVEDKWVYGRQHHTGAVFTILLNALVADFTYRGYKL